MLDRISPSLILLSIIPTVLVINSCAMYYARPSKVSQNTVAQERPFTRRAIGFVWRVVFIETCLGTFIGVSTLVRAIVAPWSMFDRLEPWLGWMIFGQYFAVTMMAMVPAIALLYLTASLEEIDEARQQKARKNMLDVQRRSFMPNKRTRGDPHSEGD